MTLTSNDFWGFLILVFIALATVEDAIVRFIFTCLLFVVLWIALQQDHLD